jgi:hypothetical protein
MRCKLRCRMRCNRPLFAAKNAFKCREICAKLGEGLAGLRTETRGVISNSEGPYRKAVLVFLVKSRQRDFGAHT